MIARLQASPLRAPLHVHVATLFVVLVLLVGGLMATQQYQNSSYIILKASDGLIKLITGSIRADFTSKQSFVANTLNLARLSPIIYARNWQERLQQLPWLQQVVQNHKGVSSFIVGYPDGDSLLVHPTYSLENRQLYAAPEGTVTVIDHLDRDGDAVIEAQRYFYNAERQLLLQQPLPSDRFDPRVRTWFQQAIASGQIEFTNPYPFFSTRNVGITMARVADGGVVVAADFTLDSLAKLMRSFELPQRSVMVLFDANGRVIAYPDRKEMQAVGDGAEARLPLLKELDVPVLREQAATLLTGQQPGNIVSGGEIWLAQVRDMTVIKSLPLRLAILIPESGLLQDALDLRSKSVIITAVILLLTIPLAWALSRFVSNPLRQLRTETAAIRQFKFDQPVQTRSFVMEIDDLSQSIQLMSETIQHFLELTQALSGEKNLDALVATVAEQTRVTSGADASVLFLYTDDKQQLKPRAISIGQRNRSVEMRDLPMLDATDPQLQQALQKLQTEQLALDASTPLGRAVQIALSLPPDSAGRAVIVPLINRERRVLGVLCMLYQVIEDEAFLAGEIQSRLAFIHTLSGVAAVSVETRQLITHQKKLFAAFIELIASAIDAKSPYTGGHCQRVPELTEMLARAACESKAPPFDTFDLNEEEWEALHVAGWLHDCGKVTTPEHVVDKATKLEARYDRIHEIRMRFELLKASAHIAFWQARANGEIGPADLAVKTGELQQQLTILDDEFAFVARCNQGSEFLADADKQRLLEISNRKWQRTLSDRLGISWEEAERKKSMPEPVLPVWEMLLADRPDHLLERDETDGDSYGNEKTLAQFQFTMVPPRHKYNLGELHNLTIARGTLSEEERYIINDHIVQTIIMLECLPYPEHLKAVPAIAGGHHEKMDGTGYPRGLTRSEMPLTARMMAIADIFEALTAADRPYKAAKTLSESLAIMARMSQQQHIDPELFGLFVKSGVYRTYAERYLMEAQIDSVDETALVAG